MTEKGKAAGEFSTQSVGFFSNINGTRKRSRVELFCFNRFEHLVQNFELQVNFPEKDFHIEMPVYEGLGMINEKPAVILEIGHAFTKAGFAGENSPRCIIPTLVSEKHSPEIFRRLYDYTDETDLYQMLVEFLHLIYFRHLLVTPKDRKVVIVESLFSVTKFRRVLARVLYLHYEILQVMWLPAHLAAVVAAGTDTALVVDVGYEEAIVVPVVAGVTLLSSIQAFDLGAKDFDKNLAVLLHDHCIVDSEEKKDQVKELLNPSIIENIRVRSCFVTRLERAVLLAEGKTEELSPKLKPFHYDVNGDNFIQFDGILREKAGEFWFQNEDLEGISLSRMILDVLVKCPTDAKVNLAKSIILAGGTTMLPGFKPRLVRDVKKVLSTYSMYKDKLAESLEFRIFGVPVQENCLNWIGGAIYGSTEAVNLRGVSKEFYLKTGQVPDWANLNYNLVTAKDGSFGSAPPGSGFPTPTMSPRVL